MHFVHKDQNTEPLLEYEMTLSLLGLNIYIVLIIRKNRDNVPKYVFFNRITVYNRMSKYLHIKSIKDHHITLHLSRGPRYDCTIVLDHQNQALRRIIQFGGHIIIKLYISMLTRVSVSDSRKYVLNDDVLDALPLYDSLLLRK